MSLLTRLNAPTFDLPGICFTTLSSPSRGARENAVWEVSVEPGVAGSPLALSNAGTQPFRALAVFPVGGQALIGDGDAFTPPWAA